MRRRDGSRNSCGACGEEGHNRQKCPTTPYEPPRKSRATRAAEQYLEGGFTLHEVGQRYGISRQAVQQAAKKLLATKRQRAISSRESEKQAKVELVGAVGLETAAEILEYLRKP